MEHNVRDEGWQVQILPLRPTLTSFAPGFSDRFPDRIKLDLALCGMLPPRAFMLVT